MTAPECDLFPLQSGDGPFQMAADEVLLDRAAAGGAGFRCYTWSEATLSLGYFQRAADRLADPRLAALPYVRRATGGGTIVHHHELTYALALPVGMARPAGEDWVCRMHRLIREALRACGVTADATGCGADQRFGEFLCFQHHSPGDVLIAGAKVVGSARRKRATAVLQHGSILLAASPAAPQLPGIAQLTGTAVDPAALADALAGTLAADTGWRFCTGDWQGEVQGRLESAERRYRDPAWNDRR